MAGYNMSQWISYSEGKQFLGSLIEADLPTSQDDKKEICGFAPSVVISKPQSFEMHAI